MAHRLGHPGPPVLGVLPDEERVGRDDGVDVDGLFEGVALGPQSGRVGQRTQPLVDVLQLLRLHPPQPHVLGHTLPYHHHLPVVGRLRRPVAGHRRPPQPFSDVLHVVARQDAEGGCGGDGVVPVDRRLAAEDALLEVAVLL